VSKAVIKPIFSVEKKNTLPTLSRKHQLYKFIVDSRGRPDTLAINLYFDEFRSWYNHKKQYKSGKVINFPKLHSKGIHVCYRFLADRYGVSEETIRRKIVKLEELGLLSRDFEQNINYGKALFNQLVIHIWQQTDYFYNPIGIDRTKIGELKPSTNHKYISSKYNIPHIHKNEDMGYPQNVDTYGTDVCIGINTDEDTKTLRPVLREEKPPSYAKGVFSSESSIIKTETNTHACDPIQQKHATFASCFPSEQKQVASIAEQQNKPNQSVKNCNRLSAREEKAVETQHKERTSENTGLFTMPELMSKILNEPQKIEEIPEMNQKEIPKITDKQERAILLSKALYGAFGEQRSNEIQADYKFVEQDEQKVCIQTKAMLLNDIEKAKIRKCIKSVYGKNVTIVMQLFEPIEAARQEREIPITAKDMPRRNWLKFKGSISDSKLLSILTNRLVKVIENGETLIIEAAPFFIEELTAGGHLTALEDAIVQSGITLELHYNGLNTQVINAAKQKITITPKQIQKDRDWIRRHREAIKKIDN